jgi:hypothetical protein
MPDTALVGHPRGILDVMGNGTVIIDDDPFLGAACLESINRLWHVMGRSSQAATITTLQAGGKELEFISARQPRLAWAGEPCGRTRRSADRPCSAG